MNRRPIEPDPVRSALEEALALVAHRRAVVRVVLRAVGGGALILLACLAAVGVL